MSKLVKQFFATIVLLASSYAFSAGGGVDLSKANTNIHDQASLQNGAKLFVNYCLACHSISLMRYQRIGDDLAIDDDLMRAHLILNDAKIGDKIKSSIDTDQAEKWFGIAPPDLSLSARAKGVDWLYSYLTSFYADTSRPFGVNNHVLVNAAMPDVLWQLKENLSADQYNNQVRDIVNFLDYVAEPIKLKRTSLGIKVILFLLVLFFLTWLLKKEYWQDVKKGQWRPRP